MLSTLGSAAPAFLIFVMVLPVACSPAREVMELSLGGIPFSVEVARTAAQREKGLMARKTLPPNAGMLFVFESDQRLEFWMKDTLVPLSIAFVSSAGVITEIRDMRPLSQDTIQSRMACRYALEVNQGAFVRAGVREGDVIRLPEGFR